ncbi:hypothetical protein WJX72_002050 [[Myrmecia] bisecta]|uniref:HVA22-like protein n=1 Tax=[Myrmecia] bisecta TaxID=41462 RepID=A0AAW1P2Y6_9CHLO
MGLWGLIISVLSLIVGLIYPAIGSIQAVESSGTEDDTQWLMYWLCYSLISIVELLLWSVLRYVPLYREIKVAVLAWLVLPQTKGATWVYEEVFGPFMHWARKEVAKAPAIERFLTREPLEKPVVRSPEEDSAQIAARKQKLAAIVHSTTVSFEKELARIAEIADPAQKKKAEKAFDKSLVRLTKIVEKADGSTSTSFFSPLASGVKTQ